VDDTGRIVREAKVASEPATLLQVLRGSDYSFKRIGLEAGPLSQWLFSGLAEAGLPVICVEDGFLRLAFWHALSWTKEASNISTFRRRLDHRSLS
jgi:hypothetical protein